jgi:hypothetical protein
VPSSLFGFHIIGFVTVHADVFETWVSGARHPRGIFKETVPQLWCCVTHILNISTLVEVYCGEIAVLVRASFVEAVAGPNLHNLS